MENCFTSGDCSKDSFLHVFIPSRQWQVLEGSGGLRDRGTRFCRGRNMQGLQLKGLIGVYLWVGGHLVIVLAR